MKIHFFANKHSSRLRYTTDFLLGQILGFEVVYKNYPIAEVSPNFFFIEYGEKRQHESSLFIPAHPFLGKKDLLKPVIEVKKAAGLPAFFFLPKIQDANLPFDLFALTFYLLSRFEEYRPDIERDHHGRFPAKESLAYQHGFLQKPLIDQWAMKLSELLQRRFPFCPEYKPRYHFLSTIDVDYAWSYLHKGWKRTIGGFLKASINLNWKELKERVSVCFGRQPDPFYTFDYLIALHERHDVKPLFFVLLGQRNTYDKNISRDHPAMQSLIQQLEKSADIGIHPSYASNANPSLLKEEKNSLEQILNKPVKKSRQHFLKLQLPDTYHRLIGEGIDEEYTMGYAEEVGFRASTAHPFYWYDLEKELVSGLRIFPFAVMDVTLKDYLQLEQEAAIALCTNLLGSVRKTGGIFSIIWHNSSFARQTGWSGWGAIYEKVLALSSEAS